MKNYKNYDKNNSKLKNIIYLFSYHSRDNKLSLLHLLQVFFGVILDVFELGLEDDFSCSHIFDVIMGGFLKFFKRNFFGNFSFQGSFKESLEFVD